MNKIKIKMVPESKLSRSLKGKLNVNKLFNLIGL